MMDVVLFSAYTVTSVVSLMLIKYWLPSMKLAWEQGEPFANPGFFVLLGLTLYVVSFILWVAVLARQPLSVAYPTAIGLTLIFSTIGALTVLGEPLLLSRVLGIGLIIAGVFLVVRA